MCLSPQRSELVQSLERATSRLAACNPENFEQIQRVIEERRHAIQVIAGWIAAEHSSSRPVSPDLAIQLKKDHENAADTLVRLALVRQATVRDLGCLRRELHLLHGLSGPNLSQPSVIDCQG